MTKKRSGGVAGPDIAEVLFEIGQRAAAAEGISEVAAFAVEQAARLVGSGHAALLQIEGESLLPIATFGWPGALQGSLDSGQVRVGDDEAASESVEPVSLFCADVIVQG